MSKKTVAEENGHRTTGWLVEQLYNLHDREKEIIAVTRAAAEARARRGIDKRRAAIQKMAGSRWATVQAAVNAMLLEDAPGPDDED